MVSDQTGDEGKTPSYHSVQQQAYLKVAAIFLPVIITLCLYRITVVSVEKQRLACSAVVITVLDLPSTRTDLRSALRHGTVVECILHIGGVQL